MSRYVNLYFSKPIDIRRASALISKEFDYGDVIVKKTGSDAFGHFATIEVTDKTISNNVLKLVGDGSHQVTDLMDLKNYREEETPAAPLEENSPVSKFSEDLKSLQSDLELYLHDKVPDLTWARYLKMDLQKNHEITSVDRVNIFNLMILMSMICDKVVEKEGSLSRSTFLKLVKWMSRIVS